MNLREWRNAKDLKMPAAAELLGLSQPSLSRIEAGEQFPSPETIEKLAKASNGEITASDLHDAWLEAKKKARDAAE